MSLTTRRKANFSYFLIFRFRDCGALCSRSYDLTRFLYMTAQFLWYLVSKAMRSPPASFERSSVSSNIMEYSLNRSSNSFDITSCSGSSSEVSVEQPGMKHLCESKATVLLRVIFACTGDSADWSVFRFVDDVWNFRVYYSWFLICNFCAILLAFVTKYQQDSSVELNLAEKNRRNVATFQFWKILQDGLLHLCNFFCLIFFGIIDWTPHIF